MTQVSLDKDLALDLINTKLKVLIKYVEEILHKWNYDSGEKFIEDVKSGNLEEAEEDAISLRHLLDQIEKLHTLKSGL